MYIVIHQMLQGEQHKAREQTERKPPPPPPSCGALEHLKKKISSSCNEWWQCWGSATFPGWGEQAALPSKVKVAAGDPGMSTSAVLEEMIVWVGGCTETAPSDCSQAVKQGPVDRKAQ